MLLDALLSTACILILIYLLGQINKLGIKMMIYGISLILAKLLKEILDGIGKKSTIVVNTYDEFEHLRSRINAFYLRWYKYTIWCTYAMYCIA